MSGLIQLSGLSRPEQRRALTELLSRQLLEESAGRFRATGRWHAALGRAAKHFIERGEAREDLRLPVVKALLDIYRDSLDEPVLIAAVDIMVQFQLSLAADA